MRVEDIDFDARRIRVRGKSGTRFVMFAAPVSRALRSHLGGRQTGYVFVERKPLQRLMPQLTCSGAWRCRWKKYDAEGTRIGFGNGFIRASDKRNYQQAVRHFAQLAMGDRIQRPLGIRPLCSGVIQKTIHKIGLRVGIKAHPYVLRHTFATHFLDNGADIRVIQEFLGHSSIRSTQVYAHVSKSNIERTFARYHPRKK